jgi:hypothetical protein
MYMVDTFLCKLYYLQLPRHGKIGHSEGFISPETASDCRGFRRSAREVLLGLPTVNDGSTGMMRDDGG